MSRYVAFYIHHGGEKEYANEWRNADGEDRSHTEFKTSNSRSKKRITMLFYEATRTSSVSIRSDPYIPPDTPFSNYHFPNDESVNIVQKQHCSIIPRGHVNAKNLNVVLLGFMWLAKGRTRRNNRNCINDCCTAVTADDRYYILLLLILYINLPVCPVLHLCLAGLYCYLCFRLPFLGICMDQSHS